MSRFCSLLLPLSPLLPLTGCPRHQFRCHSAVCVGARSVLLSSVVNKLANGEGGNKDDRRRRKRDKRKEGPQETYA